METCENVCMPHRQTSWATCCQWAVFAHPCTNRQICGKARQINYTLTYTDQVWTIDVLNDINDPVDREEALTFITPAALLSYQHQLIQ